MPSSLVDGDEAKSLRACSSGAEDPDGDYAFLSNATAAELRAAFAKIPKQITNLRLTY